MLKRLGDGRLLAARIFPWAVPVHGGMNKDFYSHRRKPLGYTATVPDITVSGLLRFTMAWMGGTPRD